MASITDPVVLKFVDEELRPVAEALQSLQSKIDSLTVRYTQQVVPAVAANANDDVVDNRVSEGIASPTKANITSMATVLSALNTDLTSTGVANLLDTFAVRPVTVGIDLS